MSIKLIVRIMEEVELPRPQVAILLAMADHADDEGRHCYPSVDRIAWKANYKPRQVVNIMRDLEKAGVITRVREATRHRPAEYRITLSKAPRKMPFQTWRKVNGRGAISQHDELPESNVGVQSRNLGVQSHNNSCCENAPQPPVEPSDEPPSTPAPAGAQQDATTTNPAQGDGGHSQTNTPHEIVVAFCEAAELPFPPANRGKAYGAAKQLDKAGITPEQIPDLVAWVRSQHWAATSGYDLGTLVSVLDKWRQARGAARRKDAPKLPQHILDLKPDWYDLDNRPAWESLSPEQQDELRPFMRAVQRYVATSQIV